VGGKSRPGPSGKSLGKAPRRSSGANTTSMLREMSHPSARVLIEQQQVLSHERNRATSLAQSRCARSGDIKKRRTCSWRNCRFHVW